MDITQKFSVHVIGNKTKETWSGEFIARKYLSHRQLLEKDRLFREFLGPVTPESSGQRGRAEALATLAVSLTKFPNFWKESNGGMDLFDDNLLAAVWDKVLELQQGETKEETTEDVKDLVEKTKKDEAKKTEEKEGEAE